MSGPYLAATKMQSTLTSNDANKHESTTTSYAKTVDTIPRRYDSRTLTAKVDKKICSFKQGPLR